MVTMNENASTPPLSATERLSSYFSKVNVVPSFPEYTGPHKVGTIDVEIPVTDLDAPSDPPPGAADIYTIQFRVFYPAPADTSGKRITWLPAPQRHHLAAYGQFLGLGPFLSSVVSYGTPQRKLTRYPRRTYTYHVTSQLLSTASSLYVDTSEQECSAA